MTNSSVVLLAGLDYKDSSIPTKKCFDYSVVAPGQQIVRVSSSRSTGSMHNYGAVSRSIFLIAYVTFEMPGEGLVQLVRHQTTSWT